MKSKKEAAIIIILCVVLVLLSGAVGMLAGRMQKQKEVSGKIASLEQKIEKLEIELAQQGEKNPAGEKEENSESGETQIPSATPAPGEVQIPEVTPVAGVTETPGVTEAPGVTMVPEITEAPGVTMAPGVTEAPGVTMMPEITEAAGVTMVPEVTEAPGATIVPTVTKEPTPITAATPTAVPTQAPTKKPEATNTPVPTKKPEPTKTPTPTKKPEPTKVPAHQGSGYYGALHVKGTILVDKNGTPVILRGISSHGLGWYPEYINETAIRQFSTEWGCNVIRLAMYTAEYNGYCTSNDAQKANLKKIVDTGVKAATENDMYVIVDWHILSDGNPNTNKAESLKFFDEVSKKYAGNPHVLYEICNEPNGGVSWAEVKKYALEVIPVIRKNAPDAVIIVGTPNWSQDVDLAAANPITEYDNIVYALHFYAATHKQSLRDKAQKAISKGLCLLVTEYGVCDASGNGALDLKEANTWINFLTKNNIGYIAWSLSNKAETASMIKSSCNKVNGFTKNDLTEGGVWLLDMLKEQAGGLGSAWIGTAAAGGQSGTGAGGSSGQSGTGTTGNGGQSGTGTGGTGGTATEPGSGEKVLDYTVYGEKYLTPQNGVSVSVSNGWDSGDYAGVQLSITIKNTSGKEERDWVRKITVKDSGKVRVKSAWNVEWEYKDGVITLKPVGHNNVIPANGSIGDIGMMLEIDN